MARLPQAFIDQVLDRTDIVDVVDRRVKLKKAGKNYSACCPFHQEKTPSFSVNPEKQFYYCFGCGAGGNALGFLMDSLHLIDDAFLTLLISNLTLHFEALCCFDYVFIIRPLWLSIRENCWVNVTH